jgi:segregation and condensation protein A
MSYKVKLQAFEGPFDLLVYLIENAQMSIYDIEISKITSQYLAYIQSMQELNVAVSTEFMVLASSLIEIKSKMILPRMTSSGEVITEEDPRTELVARLVEYKKFKRAAQILQEQEDLASGIFQKPQEDISQYLEQPEEYLSLDLKQLAGAFTTFLAKKQRIEAVRKHYTRIEREKISQESKIKQILGSIRKGISRIFSFRELVTDKKDRYDIVVTFVAVLELAKERVVKVNQKSTYGNIEIEAGEKISEGDITSS